MAAYRKDLYTKEEIDSIIKYNKCFICSYKEKGLCIHNCKQGAEEWLNTAVTTYDYDKKLNIINLINPPNLKSKYKLGDIVIVNDSYRGVVLSAWDTKLCVGKQNYTVYLEKSSKSVVCGEDEIRYITEDRL